MRPLLLRRHIRTRAFTLVEVMVAATILLFGIVSAITVYQRGMQALDTARKLSAASRLMQSEMERLRLMSWAQLDNLEQSGNTAVETSASLSFSCTREIRDVKTNMKEITLATMWRGYDGREHVARLITRYGRSGLNDYFYTVH